MEGVIESGAAAEQIPRLATPVRAKPARAGDPGRRGARDGAFTIDES
jgi:hypothetical protein